MGGGGQKAKALRCSPNTSLTPYSLCLPSSLMLASPQPATWELQSSPGEDWGGPPAVSPPSPSHPLVSSGGRAIHKQLSAPNPLGYTLLVPLQLSAWQGGVARVKRISCYFQSLFPWEKKFFIPLNLLSAASHLPDSFLLPFHEINQQGEYLGTCQ